MPKSSKKKSDSEELDAFAHHLAEVLRIARTHPLIPARLYNGIAEAWNDAQQMTNEFTDSEAYVRLHVAHMVEQVRQKGGAE